ncbi:hypothetical protein B0H17DRAFT_1215571 [Mycena rosella]|uniref:Uncharacterized protein n=1 Tax=Mycena rosella TaxID=1033263 RepID=A0AAD7FXL9_MYCRO|nr:hypothetical protein B0H17DRAFT_1215571 [Mycena rosella]
MVVLRFHGCNTIEQSLLLEFTLLCRSLIRIGFSGFSTTTTTARATVPTFDWDVYMCDSMVHGIAYTCPECQVNSPEGEDENDFDHQFHPHLNALPCDTNSQFLPPFAAPSTPPPAPPADGQNPVAWAPFRLGVEFEFAQFHFVRLQSSEGEINNALDIWAASVMEFGGRAPWRNAKELYAAIDKPTKCAARVLCPPVLHHQLACPDFKGHVDVVSYQKFNHKGQCVWSNFMSGDWAWKQADLITADKANHGCAFVAAVGGSDKTTVSVATGHQEYHPSYLSPSVLMGTASLARGRRPELVSQCDVLPDHLDDEGARLRTQTKTNTLIMCFDPGILWDDYGIHADIVPFTHGFPRTDIYELLSFDLLHQVIKGMFKDHLVSWVNKYLHLEHGEKRALKIIQDIDHRISAVPEFPGLCRFHDGRDFSQWTGDDSKVLMKINLATVAGYIPSDMVKGLSAFMDFCYLVCLNAISTAELASIQNTLHCFHQYHQIFVETGVQIDISLPR